MAIANNPDILIADEPTTALDVTVQKEIISLLKDLRDEYEMGLIFISHDLGVIKEVADDVMVMYDGKVVETGSVNKIFNSPKHPYTKGLLHALPKLDALDEPLTPIPGDIPSPLERPPGCVFHTRCPEVLADRCNSSVPQRTNVGQDHFASCFAVVSTGKAA